MNRPPDSERRSALAGLDSQVEKTITGLEQQEKARHMTKAEKQAATRAAERAEEERKRMAKRNRVMVDLPKDIEKELNDLAGGRKASISGLVALACYRLIMDNRAGKIDWYEHLEPSASPRFDWRVVVPPIPE